MRVKDIVRLFDRPSNNVQLEFMFDKNTLVRTYSGHIKSFKGFYEWFVVQIYSDDNINKLVIMKEEPYV